jgi:hypothetical protein
MVNRDAALSHHLLEISQAYIVGQILSDAEQDHRKNEMPALEHCILSHKTMDAAAETLK